MAVSSDEQVWSLAPPTGGPAHGRSLIQGDHRGHRVPDLPGVLQSLHISEVKGCDDHWTQKGRSRESAAGETNMLYKEGLPSGISLLPKRTREEPGSHRTAGVAPQAIRPGPHYGGWEGDTPWLPLGTYPPTTLSDPYPEAQTQGISREAR